MTFRTIGIDPGLDGALAALDWADAVARTFVTDTPTITVTHGKRTRRLYDLPVMAQALDTLTHGSGEGILVVIEQVSPFPGEGVVSAASMGYGAGAWHALLTARGIAFEVVPPLTWKRALRLVGRDKEAVRLAAQRRWPTAELGRKRDHGRADALWLALYAHRIAVDDFDDAQAAEVTEATTP